MSTVVVAEPSQDLLSAIAEAARNPEVDAAKMQALWHLKESIDAQQAKMAFTRAFIACRKEIKPIVKDAWNDQTKSKYARLETIDRKIGHVLEKYGFAFSWSSPQSSEKDLTITGKLFHSEGHSEEYQLTGPIDIAGIKGNSNKTPMHALASSSSYLRRYLKVMAFDLTLVNEDNDGNSESKGQLDDDQRNQLQDLLLACEELQPGVSVNLLAFLSRHSPAGSPPIKSIEDIPSVRFVDAMNTARNKLRQLRGGQ